MLRSGSGLAPWALNSERTKLNSQFLLSKLGCTIIDELFECLRNKSVDDFKKSWNAITRDANLIFDVDLKRTRRLVNWLLFFTVLYCTYTTIITVFFIAAFESCNFNCSHASCRRVSAK